jgi:signal transduction histidine kinase
MREYIRGSICVRIVRALSVRLLRRLKRNNIKEAVMKKILLNVWLAIRKIIEKYPVLVAALIIYLYYLLTSLNFFSSETKKYSLIDYIMEFDSLFFLWLAAAALIQVQRVRREHKQEEEKRRKVERVLDRQQIYNTLIKDVTMLLQDNVNNPLAVIAVTTQEIRKRFETDQEIIRWLDRIDGAMKRIHNTIRDLQSYEAQKLIESATEVLEEQQSSKK